MRVIGDPDGKGGWTVRLYYKPLVPWIWVGCLVMAAGRPRLAQRPALPRRRAGRRGRPLAAPKAVSDAG